MCDNTLQPRPIADWPAQLDHVIEDMRGAPINVHKLMAHNPTLLEAWWNFRNYSVTGGGLGKRLGELIILRVAIHMQAWYEWGSHVERALACGIREDEIARINRKVPDTDWLDKECLLLIAVDALVEDRQLSPALLAELKPHFSDAELMDMMAIQGMYLILACMIRSWGLELDSHIQAKLPESCVPGEVPVWV